MRVARLYVVTAALGSVASSAAATGAIALLDKLQLELLSANLSNVTEVNELLGRWSVALQPQKPKARRPSFLVESYVAGAPLLAEAMRRISDESSVSSLFD